MNDKVRVYHLTELKGRRRDLRKKSTKTEKMVWKMLRNNQLGVKFRRQYSIGGYVLDFYCPKARLGIEPEGEIHKTKSVKKYDEYREKYLKAFKIKIIKFDNQEIFERMEKAIQRIRSEINRIVF